jgi:hypothetical protein
MKSRRYFNDLRKVILTILLAFAPFHCFALSLTNNQGVVYANVTVMSVTPKDLLITYSSNGRTSAASIPLKSLPLGVQQQYGYDSGKEDAYKEQMVKKDAANAERLNQASLARAATNVIPAPSSTDISTPAVDVGLTAEAPDARAVRSPTNSSTPNVAWGLSDEQINELHTEWTDNSDGITYYFSADIFRATPQPDDVKKYAQTGVVLVNIYIEAYRKSKWQTDMTQILDGSAQFYIYNEDGKAIVPPHFVALLKHGLGYICELPKAGTYTFVAWIGDAHPGNLGMKKTVKLDAF